MKLKSTSHYPMDEVRELLAFAAKGISTKHVAVHVRNTRHPYYGRAYWGVPSISSAYKTSAQYLVTIRIGKPDRFPLDCKYPRLKTAPEYTMQDWKEAMVMVAAHEFRHIHQYRQRKPRSEIDAEKWAFKRLLAYREMSSKAA